MRVLWCRRCKHGHSKPIIQSLSFKPYHSNPIIQTLSWSFKPYHGHWNPVVVITCLTALQQP